MNLVLMNPSTTVRGSGQPVVGNGSRTVYQPQSAQILVNVSPDDAETLMAAGYVPLGIPILFGAGVPTVQGVDGQTYYDTAASYTAYVSRGGVWEILPNGSAGVTSLTAGTGIGIDTPTGTPTITNDGVTSLIAGAGIGIDVSTGDSTVTNDGVTSLTAGTGAKIDTTTGDATLSVDPPGHALVAGDVAGNITVTGIKAGDRLDSVIQYVYTAGATTDVTDLTAEFTITADNTINNTGHTDTTGNKLLVSWTKLA